MTDYNYEESEYSEGWEITRDGELWFSVPCKEDAIQVYKALTHDYMYKDLEDFVNCVGYKVTNSDFILGWNMARAPMTLIK